MTTDQIKEAYVLIMKMEAIEDFLKLIPPMADQVTITFKKSRLSKSFTLKDEQVEDVEQFLINLRGLHQLALQNILNL